MHLKDIMTRKFIVLYPHDSLRKAMKFIRTLRLNALPVVSGEGKLQGIFTRSNLYDALLAGHTMDDSIENFYIKKVLGVVHKDLPYDEVVRITKRSPVSTGVVVDDNGKVVGLFTKQDMLTALFKQEERYNAELEAVYRAIPHGLISVGADGRVKIFNPAAEKILGLKAGDIIGKKPDEIMPGSCLQKVVASGKIITGHKCTFKNTVVLVNCVPILGKSGIEGATVIFQDITEIEATAHELESIKRLYQILKIVLDTAYEGIVAINEEGKILFVNDAYIDFFFKDAHAAPTDENHGNIKENHTSHISLKGKHIKEVFPGSRLPRVVKTGAPEINVPETFYGQPYVVSCLPVVRDGKILGAVGKIVFKNVRQLQNLAERMKKLDNQVHYYRQELKKARDKQCIYEFDDIIGISNSIRALKREAAMAARSNSNVLICGESGTGKELFAQAIHLASSRRDRPFIKVNCSAVPENLLESEFFGYAPGAFTGARRDGKPGRFELADGGTIFLDEIGDMPLSLQSKLLQVLQDRRFERVGGTSTIQVNVRIIAATNQDLEQKIRRGLFRADLYYRLNVIQLKIPPLRSRREDISPLAYIFLEKYNRIMNADVRVISPDAMQILQNYNWPGNVRELENAIERALNFASRGTIEKEHLPPEIMSKIITIEKMVARFTEESTTKERTGKPVKTLAKKPPGSSKSTSAVVPNDSDSLEDSNNCPKTPELSGNPSENRPYQILVQKAEKEAILAAIEAANGNKTRAAEILGISRSWLYEKMNRLGIK